MSADVYTDGDFVDLDGGAVDSADSLYSGNFVDKEGYFHVVCNGSERVSGEDTEDANGGKLPVAKVDLMILAGSGLSGEDVDDQVNKLITHRIYLRNWENKDDHSAGTKALDDRAQKGIRAFAWAFGLLSDEELAQPKVRLPLHMMDGRQAVVKVQRDSDYTDKTGTTRKGQLKIKFNNDAWPVGHEKVKDVKKDREHLAMLGTGKAGNVDLSDL